MPIDAIAPSSGGSRFASLDGLRGVAALLVVFYHLQVPNHLTNILIVRNGYVAVDLFFILSGFVIFFSYSSRILSLSDFKQFMLLRFFRLYPLHLTTLSILVGFDIAKLWSQRAGVMEPGMQAAFAGTNSPLALLGNVMLVHGLGAFDELTWNVPSWSISCEFFAYVIFGWLALLGVFASRWSFLPIVVLSIAGYWFVVSVHGNLSVAYDYGFIRCLSGFFLGATIFELTRTARQSAFGSWPLIGVTQAFFILALALIMSETSGPAIVAVIPIFSALVATLQFDTGMVAKFLMLPVVQFLGRISYSIYMIHYVFIYAETAVLKRVLHIPVMADPVTSIPTLQTSKTVGDVLAIVSIAMIIIISAVTYRAIESPTRNWGRKLLSLRTRSIMAAS